MRSAVAAIPLVATLACAVPGPLEDLGRVELSGPLHAPEDLSAAALVAGTLLLASDEGARVEILDRAEGRPGFAARDRGVELDRPGVELDLEGLAVRGTTVFAVGSHSLRRRRLDPALPVAENRRRLIEIDRPRERDRLFRFALDPASGALAGPIEQLDLRARIERDPLLAPFGRVPGKENGVDVEGLAVLGERLYVGFRSPVLRSGHVPVLVLDFDAPDAYELRFVQLDGAGIRDLAATRDALLVLAAADGAPESIWLWDGRDDVPGAGATRAAVRRIGDVPREPGAVAEGLAVVEQRGATCEVLVVYDGRPVARRLRLRLPALGPD